jgi:hypothetical protein
MRSAGLLPSSKANAPGPDRASSAKDSCTDRPAQSGQSRILAFAPAWRGISVQRTCGCADAPAMAQEEAIKRSGIQPALNISTPGDPSEVEADRIADEVMRMPEGPDMGTPVQEFAERGTVNRACASCAAHRAAGDELPTADGISSVVARGTSGGGQRLDAGTRAFMESRFRRDFSHVRLHTGGGAADSARSINALAYTVGSDIVFGAGRHSPDRAAGRRILAHELAHTVQQGSPLPPVRRQEDAATPMAGGAAAASHTFAAQGVNIILRPSCASVAGFSFALVEAAVRDALDKIFNTACIEETHRKAIQANLRKNGFEFRAADSATFGGACAEGTGFNIPANIATLGKNALAAGCGPLASTVLHEIVHIVRGFFAEQLPVSCEASCYGQPGDPTLCRDTDVKGRRVGGAPPKTAS